MQRLSGRRVVVTDCDELIGPEIAVVFREAGAEVLVDRRDLTAPQAAAELIAQAGHVDVLVANLAAPALGRLAIESDDAELDLMLDRMVRPLHRLVRAVLPQMIARRSGKIVVVGAGAALRGVPRRAVYSAARAAQHGYVRSVAMEAAPHNVQVNATAQTFVENPTYFPPAYQKTSEFQERMRGVPAGRLATAREAATFLLTLAGPESDFIVGQVFPFTGGWVH
ncbi:SDR family NAD(P)-dependent oxidoreductase [Methylobacterium radiotolerans]|uniref:SDR family NAD(P)-dependent oxidoreductase n=1 Tax=Methylobacterium radiotolerans TaxID=31998 RepID=UPI0038CFB457